MWQLLRFYVLWFLKLDGCVSPPKVVAGVLELRWAPRWCRVLLAFVNTQPFL